MKIISFTIPCYNSEAYMEKCIQSLLLGGDDVEIIIVDDGSTDSTPQIADRYEKKYPGIVRAIHQENGGHGEGLNTGIKNATGVFFKVVDSDDWLDADAYKKVLAFLKESIEKNYDIDLLISNYVYEKQGAKRKKVMNCKGALPENTILTWEDKISFNYFHYMLMHSVIFRTETIRESGVVIPKHTFYVDSIFLLAPLPYVKKMYYLNVDLYRYYIGRDDQSVNEKVMVHRMDQQIRVNKEMIRIYKNSDIKYKSLENCMCHYIEVIMCVASTFLMLEGSKESLEMKEELWQYTQATTPELYKKLRKKFLIKTTNMPGLIGKKIYITGYRVIRKIFQFN